MTAARSSGWSCSTSTASEAPAAPPSARTAAVSAKTGAATGTARPRALAELARPHRQEYLALLAGYAGARRAGPKLVYKITRRAQRLLQLAHPAEYQALYAAERAKLATPTQQRPAPPHDGPAG